MTAKQVILQRLREAEHDVSYGEYAGREGDVISGIIQQAPQRPGAPLNRNVMVKLGHPRGLPRGDAAAGRAGPRRGLRARQPAQVPGRRASPAVSAAP